ncbi:MAG TPA: hypothetical protein VIN40_08795 [Candidatus Tyrphobacter sp.]
MAIVAAVLVYFLGYFYLYYYFVNFGVSMIATNIAPLDVFIYAYNVLAHQPWVTAVTLLVIVSATTGYIYELTALNDRIDNGETGEPNRAGSGHGHIDPRSPEFQLGAVHVLAVLAFIACFPLAAAWARHVAMDDAATVFDRAHEGFPQRLHVVLTQSGVDFRPTTEFARTLVAINTAGNQGRAILVGEDADRVFIVVGAVPKTNDDPRQRLPGDLVVALQKQYVTIEEI